MTMAIPTNRALRPTGCYQDAQSVTKSDATALEYPCDALMVSGAGNLNIITPAGTTLVIAVSANVIYPIRATWVLSTSTTATGIVALYL